MLFATEKSSIIYNANPKTSVNSNICPKEKYTWKKDKKTKRHIKMHGGNPIVITSLDELEDPNNYLQIYVGVETKWHSFISRSQLLPSFLNRDSQKSLILLIDTFTEKELQETQSQITDLYR